jgi:hypothetical protein
MNSRYLLAGVIVLVVVVMGSMRLMQITGSASSTGGSQQIQVVIDDGYKPLSYSVTLSPRETALNALILVATPDYRMHEPSVYITSINGIKEDSDHTWIFLVNDKLPAVACDQYYPVSGDVIKFKYMTSTEAAAYF